jgi:hypothetical protein
MMQFMKSPELKNEVTPIPSSHPDLVITMGGLSDSPIFFRFWSVILEERGFLEKIGRTLPSRRYFAMHRAFILEDETSKNF